MNEAEKQELERLLNDALSNLKIKGIGGRASSIDDHKIQLQKVWNNCFSREAYGFMTITPTIKDKTVNLALHNFIKNKFQGYFSKEGRTRSAACYLVCEIKGGITVDMLLGHLLNIALCKGVEKAVSSFERSTQNKAYFQYMALLEGISISDEVQIFKGVKLTPLPSNKAELPLCLPTETIIGRPPSFTDKTILVVDSSVSPIFSKLLPDDNNRIREPCHTLDNSNRIYSFKVLTEGVGRNKQDIDDFWRYFRYALALAWDTTIQIGGTWSVVSPDEFFNPSYGMAYWQDCPTTTVRDPWLETTIKESMIEKIIETYNTIVGSKEITKKIRIPICRWIESKAPKIPADQIIDLSIALEALYLPKNNRDALSYKLALHAARYLGEDKEGRRYLFDMFKIFYKCRSKVVHGGELGDEIEFGDFYFDCNEFVDKMQNICKASILNMIEEGRIPDSASWRDIVLS